MDVINQEVKKSSAQINSRIKKMFDKHRKDLMKKYLELVNECIQTNGRDQAPTCIDTYRHIHEDPKPTASQQDYKECITNAISLRHGTLDENLFVREVRKCITRFQTKLEKELKAAFNEKYDHYIKHDRTVEQWRQLYRPL